MAFTKLILIRHGECAGNREGLFRGRTDFPLNELGKRQAESLREAMRYFDVSCFYTSALKRSRETAEITAEPSGAKVFDNEGLMNICLGAWEGRPKKEIEANYPAEWDTWLKDPEKLNIPGAETLDDVMRRSISAVERIVSLHSGEIIALVSHRAVLKPMIAGLIGISSPYFWRVHLDTASYSIISHEAGRGYCLRLLNETGHLPEYISENV